MKLFGASGSEKAKVVVVDSAARTSDGHVGGAEEKVYVKEVKGKMVVVVVE